MRISFGLSAANRLVGRSPARKAEQMRARREKRDMKSSMRWRRHQSRWWMEADQNKTRHQPTLGRGPRFSCIFKAPASLSLKSALSLFYDAQSARVNAE